MRPPAPGRFLDFFEDGVERIRENLLAELKVAEPGPAVPIFFRADDIGVISSRFLRLLRLFDDYQVELCLAVVPVWLTGARWGTINDIIDAHSPRWCWHQHGWSHISHQKSGKKSEFGPERQAEEIRSDLVRGRNRLEAIIGPSFFPVFTPPWNRCSGTTVDMLADLGYTAISRSSGEQKNPASLPDYHVNVDLHTRKEADPASALDNICGELRRAVNERYIGVMIHHQLMDENHFRLLEMLLQQTATHPGLQACSFAAMG
jgi:hypothetical protein